MCKKAKRRSGFTLIELLVIIALIAVLVGLGVAGYFQVMESQRASNTETMMRTVDQTLQKHWSQVISDAHKEIDLPPDVTTLAGGDNERARVIWKKLRLIEAFPTSYAEIGTPIVYNPIYGPLSGEGLIPVKRRKYNGTYVKILAKQLSWPPPTTGPVPAPTPPGSPTPFDPTTESAACLLMALSISRAHSPVTEDQLGSNAADTDGDGIKEIVDAWGKPLRFFRFPTNNAVLQAANPNAPGTKEFDKVRDPLDPQGKLLDPTWSAVLRAQFELICGNNFKVSATGTYPSYYTIPVIVSSGRNQKMGLDTDMSLLPIPTNPNDANDNIYNFRLRLGAPVN